MEDCESVDGEVDEGTADSVVNTVLYVPRSVRMVGLLRERGGATALTGINDPAPFLTLPLDSVLCDTGT